MTGEEGWTLRVAIRLASAEEAEWLFRALRPESTREVPRASARLGRPDATTVEIRVEARDTGAARAASNTFLGWVHLTMETLNRARASAARGPG